MYLHLAIFLSKKADKMSSQTKDEGCPDNGVNFSIALNVLIIPRPCHQLRRWVALHTHYIEQLESGTSWWRKKK